ncbi:chitin binding peritrophin-A domain-containing protein [Wenxinia marina]|uniref:TPR repeat protein n=1 Tax=Wenxinia marina DSM 24838 TaxID=1123501 RepID=A0A0D0Q9T3_9RHOB|nr:chitin binding peritrophin-A domain-containing protein [Wenxinia marina]KIQ69112.1 TPR repeat protein [Wenxinia marina DSM 24838]GGL70347.1 hypothetical protein GCM10011392_26220 [Wenxinia marina]
MRLVLASALALVPVSAFAVGTETPPAPEPSPTAETCDDGLVWDIATETCLPPEESTNEDSAMLNDARRLNYEGRYDAALSILATLPADDPMALTLRGYALRKGGDMDGGLALYQAALDIDPDLLLTRSYRGMAYLELGDYAGAWTELQEIRVRGGAGSWPEQALEQAIRAGVPTTY